MCDPRLVLRRLILLLAVLPVILLPLAGCVSRLAPPGPAIEAPTVGTDAFVMPDGARLPYRAWLPDGPPDAVVLALHGMNDSRDAWEYPAPDFAAAGIAVFAPDQRGFGATATRGFWPGTDGLVSDARAMTAALRARYPHTRLILMGESMGAAVLMLLATSPDPPAVNGYVLIAPAVWGRAKMNLFLRSSLWLASHTVPGLTLTGRGVVRVTASSNIEALRRLSRNKLTIKGTRVDAIRGLVDLMDAALAAAPRFDAPALFVYGGKDELIPPAATAATWRALPEGERHGAVLAFYPDGYHLALRDLDRDGPIRDITAWIRHPDAPLPSGADKAATAWLRARK
ncbi:MAG: alpha/beta fold hydrolase [Acetobacteraceae bacterium]